jgi:catechol 2,3-dioxygenase-like lactoylglutathione lyase family enzyme
MMVRDINRAASFFIDILGFETLVRYPDYAYVHRETAGFRIWEQTGKDAAPPGTRRFAYYIDVRNVDRLYAELKPKLDTLPKGDVHGLANKPDGNLLAFGQAIGGTSPEVHTHD